MNWIEYKDNFFVEAKKKGYNEEYIVQCLRYAYKLFSSHLPIIYDHKHFSLLVGFEHSFLYKITNQPRKFYRSFSIKKRNGTNRNIDEPLPALYEIQKWIYNNILINTSAHKSANAYTPKKSTKTNAKFHRKQKLLLRLDVQDFFGSITIKKVFNVFKGLGYSKDVATLLSRLCTLDYSLPQGAPTSPSLSNLVFAPIDEYIFHYCRERFIRYTRYADDMYFSGEFEIGALIRFVKKVVAKNHLRLNTKKTRLMRRHQRQIVTGIVVNSKLQAPREMRRELRQEMFYINKYGLNSHLDRTNMQKANYVNHLIGKAYYISNINKADIEIKKYIQDLKKLL